ncbi:MAG: hypothetical protein LBJ73_02635 [Rickettsiales bacterium]|jgi:hypothetical protein|nr:hypothetical protein [Rickettsiales bacterium]
MIEKQSITGIIDFLRGSWFLIMFVGGLVYWAARQDSSMAYVQKDEVRITALENRAAVLESGIGQLKMKIDGIKEDVTLIKAAVIK